MKNHDKIWFKSMSLEDLRSRSKNTLVEHLGIEFLEIGPNFLKASMPVDHRTCQPLRILHGGASLAFAETLASVAANYVVDYSKQYAVGLEINANHIKSAREGEGAVIGYASPLHLGKKTHVWDIRIEKNGELLCISRMTAAILDRK